MDGEDQKTEVVSPAELEAKSAAGGMDKATVAATSGTTPSDGTAGPVGRVLQGVLKAIEKEEREQRQDNDDTTIVGNQVTTLTSTATAVTNNDDNI